MFKQRMIDDCRLIFGMPKVIFGTVDEGIEQGALYIDVEQVKETPLDGKYSFRVKCRLGTLGTKQGNPYGYLLSSLRMAYKKPELAEIASRFLVSSPESDIKYAGLEGYMTQTTIDVIYRTTISYDPPHKTKGWIGKIKEMIFND